MALLALPEKPAAAAAFLMAPLLRSSMPRAALPSARSSPASTTSVPTGAADREANSISSMSAMVCNSGGLQKRPACELAGRRLACSPDAPTRIRDRKPLEAGRDGQDAQE